MSCPKITITGDIGSGKSAVGRLLSGETGFPLYSTGTIQRRIAARHGMSTLELNRYSETHPEIDQEIDGESIALGQREESFILDSRLAWHFIPRSFKVYLAVDSRTAAQRILGDGKRQGEAYDDLSSAFEQIEKRRRCEVERFLSTYDVDLSDLGNYDLVVDTSSTSPEEVAAKVLEGFNEWSATR